MDKILVINADDLGYTRGVNDAILECAKGGLLRSATLMAGGEAFEDAVRRVKTADIGVGVHLVLTELEPVLRPRELPGLVGESGLLPSGPRALMAALRRRGARDSIGNELYAQVARVVDHGLKPTHLDSHKHVHLLPPVLASVIEIARKFSIRWVRNPFDYPGCWRFYQDLENDNKAPFLKQYSAALLSTVFKPGFAASVRRSGLRAPDRFFGVSVTGFLDARIMAGLLERLPPGTNELMVHPGNCDEDLRARKTRLLRQREVEKEVLLSPVFSGMLREHKIVLKHFGEEIP